MRFIRFRRWKIFLSILMTLMMLTGSWATMPYTAMAAASGEYTAQAGTGAFQLTLTSVPSADINVLEDGAEGTYLNVINTPFNALSAINFDITLTGSGTNNYPEATQIERVAPYIKILDSTKETVVAEYSSGTGTLKYNGSESYTNGTISGTTVKMGLDANTLAPDTEYYLYIDPELKNKQSTPMNFGKTIYFRFRTSVATADTTAPVITLSGDATMNLTVGDTFTEPGFTAADDVDGNITDAVIVGGDTVNTSAAGTYTITYNVSDAAGNAAVEVTRTVIVAAANMSAPYWAPDAALTVSDVTGTGFNLNWNEANNAEGYKVVVSNSTGGVTTDVLNTTINEGTACAVTGLTANRRYDIKVTATNSAGNSPASLQNLAVTTPDKPLFVFNSGTIAEAGTKGRYLFQPSGTKGTETTFEQIYTYDSTVNPAETRFLWYLQAGFKNTNAREHVDSFRLFNLTDDREIALNYGTTDFGSDTNGWTASGVTESDTGYTLTHLMTSGDFKVAKMQPGSVWIRFELDIAKYLEPGKEYAITIDPQFHTGGQNPNVLGKVYSFQFVTAIPEADTQTPTWDAGAEILVSDITTNGFVVSYPAASDNVGVVKYSIVLKKGSTDIYNETTADLNIAFAGLDQATEYNVSVTAEDAAGNKSAVLSKNITTLQDNIPTWAEDAKLVISNITATEVTINWPYSNTPQYVAGYALYINGTEEARFLPNDYYYELGGLLSSTKYVFELRPFNAEGRFGEGISAMVVTSGAGKLGFATTFAVEETAGSDYYQNYVLKYPLDLDNFRMAWNFDRGIDKYLAENLAGIRLYEKESGVEITLDKGTAPYEADDEGTLLAGDFRYTKSGGGEQSGVPDASHLRLLVFEPSAATLTQFTVGKEYVLEMQPDFISNNGDSTLGKIITFTFSIAPEDNEAPVWPAEAALQTNKVGPESMVLIWPAATDNQVLKEYRLVINGGDPIVIDAQADTTYQLTGLTPDTLYSITLEAVDAKNNKSVALVQSVRTLKEDKLAPTWPTGSTLIVNNIATDNADLLWSAADDNVAVTGYKIYNGEILLADTDACQLHITGLTPATIYSFRIEAVDKAGNVSSTGPMRIIRTLDGVADTEAPQWNGGGGHTTTTSTDLSRTYVTLQWPWATDNVAVTEYRIYLDGEYLATVSDIVNSYSGTLPLDGKNHNYEVYAYDAAGNRSAVPQSFSVMTGTLPDDLIAPYWPAGSEIILSDFTDKTVVMNWTEAMDNKEVVSYLLKKGQLWVVWLNKGEDYPGYFSFADRKIWFDLDKLMPLNLTYNHPRQLIDLIEGEPYSCSLKAYDALGNSTMGGPEITFYPGTKPTAGSGIAFTLSNVENSRGTLSSRTGAMNVVDNPTDPAQTSFEFDFECKLPANYADGISLYNKATNESVTLTAENFVYQEEGTASKLTLNTGVLAANTTYVLKFSKDFSSSTGTAIGFDMAWEFTTATADKEAPTWENGAVLDVAFLVSPNAATLTWPAAVDNVQVTQYKVFKGDELLVVLAGDTREYLAENLNVDTAYNFTIQAGDYLGNWSTPLKKAVITPSASTTPPDWGEGILTFTDIHSDNLTFKWTAASGEYKVKEYLVFRNDESEPLAVLSSDILTYRAEGLTGETNYTFKIIARDYSGNSSVALINSVTTAIDDVNPTWPANAFLNAKDLKSDSFTLYWQAALDNIAISHYNIYKNGELIGSTANGTFTEYTITGLEPTTKYNFMVEAVDTKGNVTVDKLVFEQSTTVSGPTEGSGIAFTMISPSNENVGKSGNVIINRVTEPLLDANVAFNFNFAKELAPDTWLTNIELIKNEDISNPIELKAEYVTYTFADETGTLKIEIPQEIVVMGASYQLKLKSSFAAKDGSTLGKDFIWQFNVAEGLYGIKDIAAGVNAYSAWEAAADRFYLMLKTDGTVWGWGNNLYGHLGDGTTQNATTPVQALNLKNIVKIVTGRESAFAIDADGAVWAWGSNEHGQLGRGVLPTGTSGRYGNETPQKIEGLPPIVDLVYGYQRVIALDVNGDVWTWGFRTGVYQSPYGVLSTGTPTKVESLSNITDVTIGYNHSLAVTADGQVLYWYGIDDTPSVVSGVSEVKSVACYGTNYTKHNLVLKKDGTVWYWGEGTTVVTTDEWYKSKLVVDLIQVEGAEKIKEIYPNSLSVLTNDRSVRRIDIDFEQKTAVLGEVVNNLTDISKLAVYTSSSRTNPVSGGLALKLDGTLLQFIDNTVTPIELGMDTVEPPVWPDDSAVIFTNCAEQGLTLNWNSCGDNISAYALYQDNSLVAVLPGTALAYSITGLAKGQEYTYKVEARFAGSSFTTNGPSAAVTLSDWNPAMQGAGKIAAGNGHTLLIDDNGNVWAWGNNEFGQLGIGSSEDKIVPCKIDGLNNIIAVAVGDSHSLALDSNGDVWVWGKNDKYQLGLGTVENSKVPVKLASISGVKAISAAGNYNLAVKNDGTLWSWGEACNANLNYAISGIDGQTPGQMKYGTPKPSVNYYYENVKGIAASRNFYAVLFADGTISRSGYFIDSVGARTYGTMLSNPGLMGVQAISAGDDFLMALLEDGTVAVLGDNSQGQYGNGTRSNPTPAAPMAYAKVEGLKDVAAISAGGAHGLAVKKDGSVWGWGQNNKGQLGNGNAVTQLVPAETGRVNGITAIDAGTLYSIVLKNAAAAGIEAYAFGANDQGQLGTGDTVSVTTAKRVMFEGYVDTEAPLFPDWFAIYVLGLSDDSASLLWSEAEDNIGVVAYEIWQDGAKVGEVSGDKQTFTVTGLIPGQAYEFGIKALDEAGNNSGLSRTISWTAIAADYPQYLVVPVADDTYTNGENEYGIKTMTVNDGVSGFKYFKVSITPVVEHSGDETVVFVHLRNGAQIALNATTANFDGGVSTAQAGFNVQADDVVKTYIVDELTNEIGRNPIIFQ